MIKNDAMGKTLAIGDEVYFVNTDGIKLGKISKFLDNGFYVDYNDTVHVVKPSFVVKAANVEVKRQKAKVKEQ